MTDPAPHLEDDAPLVHDPVEPFTPVVGSSGMSYRPLLELGQGGMARVFLARAAGSAGFTKLVVLKVMRRENLADEGATQMFLAEARLSARLNHPNLVQVYDVDTSNDVPCLVMEYLEGKPLSAVHAGGLITQGMLLSAVSEALLGLHHAHELRNFDGTPLNIVHRDVSPHNVFVSYDGSVKVLDFGIAKAATSNSKTVTGDVKGKLTYMAPEQLLGTELDRRADIFAVGSMLWEIAVGGRLWENITQAALIHKLANGDIPRPSQRAEVDPELERIIMKSMAPQASDRYATALELHGELEAYLASRDLRCSARAIGAALGETFKEERFAHSRAVSAALKDSLPPPPLEEGTATAIADASGVKPTRRAARYALPLALLAAAALAALFLRARAEHAAPAATPAPPASIVVSIRVQQAGARIEIDGKDVGTGQVALRVPKDTNDHELRISAPSYASDTRIMKFDRSSDLDIVLSKAQSTAPLAEPSTASSAVTSSASDRRAAVSGKHLPVAGAARVAPSAPSPASAAPTENQCDPPYYFDHGIKTFKPNCL